MDLGSHRESAVYRDLQGLYRHGQSECVDGCSPVVSTAAAIVEASDAQGNEATSDWYLQ